MQLNDIIVALQPFKKKEKAKQLYTVWGENLDSSHVLEEYPRPQLKRKDYTILNGLWEYAFTDGGKPEKYEGSILVPFSPESILSGVSRQLKPEEYLWYAKTLYADGLEEKRNWEKKRCILHFGGVDQACIVYINQQEVIRHTGGYLPFSVDITTYLQEGENQLTVKVRDLSDTSFRARGKQKINRGGMFYTAQSGIWQTVWMEWVPKIYITELKMDPDLDGKQIWIKIKTNAGKGCTSIQCGIFGHIKVSFQGQTVIEKAVNNPDFCLELPMVKPWSPEHPNLYDIELHAGEDVVKSYFAMRKFEICKDQNGITRFFLNHEPYFMNGVLDQGYWSDGLMTAPSDEAYIFDILKMKELGFNTLRKHCKIEPLRWYYHCDRLGMLVWQDMVNGGEEYNMERICYLPTVFSKVRKNFKDSNYWYTSRQNAAGRREWQKECKDTVKLLYNVCSLAVWVPFNEGWGQFDANKAAAFIKKLDKSRLIDQASGWFDQGGGDFCSVHIYFDRLFVKPEKRAFIISEFGGYACLIKEHSYSEQIYGYRRYETMESFQKAFQNLYKEEVMPLVKKGLCGAIYTQLSDVEEEVNGLLTYDRKQCKVIPLHHKK